MPNGLTESVRPFANIAVRPRYFSISSAALILSLLLLSGP